MVPFDSIKFTGNYGNMTEISYQTAKRAAKKGRSTTTLPASGRNVAATSPSAPTCINNRSTGKKAAYAAFFFFHPPPLHAYKTLRKIPRLSAILHFYAISPNKYSGFTAVTSGMQWKRNWA
jgi:hypothetical protein